jgi:hypothetical protein
MYCEVFFSLVRGFHPPQYKQKTKSVTTFSLYFSVKINVYIVYIEIWKREKKSGSGEGTKFIAILCAIYKIYKDKKI